MSEDGPDYAMVLMLRLSETVTQRHGRLILVLVTFILDDRAVFRIAGQAIVINLGNEPPGFVELIVGP